MGWSIPVDKLVNGTKADLDAVVRKVTLDVFRSVVLRSPVDTGRFYLTGLSMGGYGSWKMAAENPGRFAAVSPICGKGDPANAEKLIDLPIWVFHGTEDKAVPYQHSVDMVEAIRNAGGEEVRFTTLKHIGHNSWSAAYATPELYDWFDRHKRAE